MRFHARPRLGALLTAALACVFVASACSAPGAPVGATTPPGSSSAACPTAPALTEDPEGWGPPSTAPEVVPLLINGAPLVCGSNRVLIGITDKAGSPIGDPDRTVKLAFFDLGRDAKTAIATVDATFMWAIEGYVGVYHANVAFPDAGRYGVEVTTAKAGAGSVTLRMTFDVRATSPVVKVGDKAPASKTPTLADAGGDPTRISTDAKPDPAMYQTSVDQAIAGHKPFVLIFATPKFCKSAQCGPTLDRIKPYVARYPGVTFIHVEPYKLKLVDGTLQADLDASGGLQTTSVTDEWHLVSEPNVFVVNRDGIVTANFELIFSDDELAAALDAVK